MCVFQTARKLSALTKEKLKKGEEWWNTSPVKHSLSVLGFPGGPRIVQALSKPSVTTANAITNSSEKAKGPRPVVGD